MKQSKVKLRKQKHQKLIDKFKQHCIVKIKRDPPNHILKMIKQNTLDIDLNFIKPQQIIYVQTALSLPFNILRIIATQSIRNQQNQYFKSFYQSSKFKGFLKSISNTLQVSENLKSVIIQGIPLTVQLIKQLRNGIQVTKKLKQLCIRGCNLTDEHLSIIKESLILNKSLISLDLSKNKFVDIGQMIGKILSQHSQRRNDIIWVYNIRGQTPQQDISNNGLCQINLQQNQLNDKSISQLISFLKDDNWTRCLNLRHNKITQIGVTKFAYLLKKNKSLISIDLRDNPGFTKQLSRNIYKKLVANMQTYKLQKKNIEKNINILAKRKQNHKSLEQSRRKSPTKRFQFTLRNNATLNIEQQSLLTNCVKCKQTTFDYLKLQKRNLDLQFELRKVKHILLTKNIDISAIFPQNVQVSGSWSFNRQGGEQEDLLGRMEQMMMELTRIMEAIQNQQQTITQIDNPMSNPNSLSNTTPLFSRPQELQISHDQQQN